MKKIFTFGSTEYTVCTCTAIAKDIGECERRKALFVYSFAESGEKSEYVLFGYDMPEDESEFLEMCGDSSAWDGWYETVETVEIAE